MIGTGARGEGSAAVVIKRTTVIVSSSSSPVLHDLYFRGFGDYFFLSHVSVLVIDRFISFTGNVLID